MATHMDDDALHAMIDIETLGTAPGCVVLSVGIVAFRTPRIALLPDGTADLLDWKPLSTLKRNIDIDSCQRAGLGIEAETLIWWMGQSDAARADAFTPERTVTLRQTAETIHDYLRTFPLDNRGRFDGFVWCHGATFDAPILNAACKAVGLPLPIDFRKVRDTRTMYDVAGTPYHGVAHEPIADAMAQTLIVIEGIERTKRALEARRFAEYSAAAGSLAGIL